MRNWFVALGMIVGLSGFALAQEAALSARSVVEEGAKALLTTLLAGLATFLLERIRRRSRRIEEYKRFMDVLLVQSDIESRMEASQDLKTSYDALARQYADVRSWLAGDALQPGRERDYTTIVLIASPSIAVSLLYLDAMKDPARLWIYYVPVWLLVVAVAVFLERYLHRHIPSAGRRYMASFFCGIALLALALASIFAILIAAQVYFDVKI